MRLRRREAVSGILVHAGCKTRKTCAVSIEATGSAPIFGSTWVPSEVFHSRACFWFVQLAQ